ncbi:glycosyltransferase [Aeromonas caviae]
MKKICFFIGSLNATGGTERVASVIASEFQCRGYQIHMLSLQCGDEPFFELADGIHISQLFTTAGRGMLRLPQAIIKLRRYLQQHQIDILIDVESMLALYALPAVVGLNVRHICWEHFNYHVDLGKASRRLARKLAARFADDVITLTERDKQLWLANTTCKAHITAIPNPVTIALPPGVRIVVA